MDKGIEQLLEECRGRSLELLRRNSRELGVIASAENKKAADRNYASVFGRDAAICALGMIASGDPELCDYAEKSLRTLGEHQAPNGQIPKFVKPEEEEGLGHEVDFWYTGCIDATLWWLLALDFHDRHRLRLEEGAGGTGAASLKYELRAEVRSALQWLGAQEHQSLFLLMQNEASDWADIMPRSGFVLYTNALWYRVKRLYKLRGIRRTKAFFNTIFLPFSEGTKEDHRRASLLVRYILDGQEPVEHYLSFVNFSWWGTETDVFGNILALLFGLGRPRRVEKIVKEFIERGASTPWPVRVVLDPIRRDDPHWRKYMYRHGQNKPHQYHNGGIWPFVGGFWVLLLARTGRYEEARRELGRMAEALRLDNWRMSEWLNGKTGKPAGMPGQSWNAALFLLADRLLSEGEKGLEDCFPW